ncbi:MAG: carboxylesterase family protein, partial [Planctomycetota bacterium]
MSLACLPISGMQPGGGSVKFLPFLCTVFGAATVAAAQPLVDAPCGSVRGVETHGAQAFLGIPYGETTSGANRWRPPRPKRPWPGIRDCTKYGPICPQESKTSLASGGASEDCLNLNVWTPRTVSRPLPVMVWIHGGAFVSGAGSLPIYEGASLALRGVVVVTLNYRLGVLGFLAHPELTAEGQGESGNYGVLDVIEALRWVQTNIRSFGGDPARVTVFGQSAGAALIRVLLVSPVARGLFQRAILESGPAGQLPYLQRSVSYLPSAESFGSTFAERVLGPGLARTSALRRLRETPVRDLLAAMGGRQNFLD